MTGLANSRWFALLTLQFFLFTTIPVSPSHAALASTQLLVIEDTESSYLPGDADGDGKLTEKDALFLLEYLYLGGQAPKPYLAGDADQDEDVDHDDLAYLSSRSVPLAGRQRLSGILQDFQAGLSSRMERSQPFHMTRSGI